MRNIKEVADAADVIVNGYAYTKDGELRIIREFIKDNYKEMYMKWAQKSDNGFYGE